MGRICIITPGQLGSNPRVVKEAEALSNAGHQVHVISTRVLAAVESRDISVLDEAQFSCSRIDLTNRWKRLPDRLLQILLQTQVKFAEYCKWADCAYSSFTRPLTAASVQYAADLYIAHYVAALPAAVRAAARYGARYAFDAEDFHSGELSDIPPHAIKNQLIRAIEGRYLPGAAYVSASSPLISEAYAKSYSIPPPITILNTFSKRNAPSGPTLRGSVKPGPSLYWFSQTIGPGRGLETAIEAIAKSSSAPHLYLRGMLMEGYDDHLQRLAVKAGIADRLHFLEPTVPAELERLGADYDLGFIGEGVKTPNRSIALTNKLFSYAISGLPILASDIPAHRSISADFGPAMSLFDIDDPHSLASRIDALLLDSGRLSAARAHAWHLGQQTFNWDIEQLKLVSRINQVIGSPGLVA